MISEIFEQTPTPTNQTIIFIDGSYYCFYRYFALLNWWKITFPEEPLEDPLQNPVFVEKFKKVFINTIKELPKKLNIDKSCNPILIVGKDCKREKIWRNEICVNSEYKGNRKNGAEDGFMGGPFIKMAYDDHLFIDAGVKTILKHPKLEADDCIAIYVKHILEKYPQTKIYIITSDKDYLQLAEPRVELYNLMFKKLTDQKSCSGDPKCDLFCKIVMGDPSDNIKSVLKGCGPKTAMKCFENREYFEERLKKENAYEMYNLNKKLIDFNEIQINLVDEFINSITKM